MIHVDSSTEALPDRILLRSLCPRPAKPRHFFGTVTDTSGATMPGTRITVTDITTNSLFTTESNQAGFYSAPGLAVGEYQVAGERPGFTERHHLASGSESGSESHHGSGSRGRVGRG